ncbi:MAG TPA: pyrroline-5-carboxylate reductase [Solimonas sp.]|nr:pyrroline-5-carboxylate reductase [Solimonas sp.]
MAAVIAFIGGGNMAASLIGGLIAAGHPRASLRVAEPSAERRDWLQRELGIEAAEQASAITAGASAVVLAVKPQQARAACDGLRLDPGTVLVSIAAGLRLESLRRWLGGEVHYVRTMPNTPALLRAGITGLYAPPETPVPARQLAEQILATAGECVWLDAEEQMDAVTALSGSGPAYFFLLTEVLREAGEKLGLSPTVAAQLARQTCIGSARMVEGPTDVVTLRANVTSKGGTTEAAVRQLEAGGLRTLFADALTAAARRGGELGDQLSRES